MSTLTSYASQSARDSAVPASSNTGLCIFRTDTKAIEVSDGTNYITYEPDSALASGTFTSNSYSGYFDGSNDYIDTGNKFDFIQQTCEFTVTCWAKWTNYNASSGSVNQSIIATTPTGGIEGLYFYYDSRGTTRNLKVIFRGATFVTLTATNGIGDNDWHHYAISSSGPGGSLKLYKNGSVIASGTSPAVSSNTANHTMHLGIGVNPTAFYGPLIDAYLDEVAIFNRELTSTEISNIINNKSYTNFSAMYRLENNADDEIGLNNGNNNGVSFETSEKPY